jgi:hypothetical protein
VTQNGPHGSGAELVNVVSSTIEPSRYRRVESNGVPSAGRIDQWPAASSRMRPKTDGESKRGRHNQSIEPSRLTSALDRQSDSIA